MADRPVEQLTLREMFTEAERHSRELIDHLEKGFLPKSHTLLKLVRGKRSDPAFDEVEDLTIYNSSQRLLIDDEFTQQQFQRLAMLFAGIQKSVEKIVKDQAVIRDSR